MREELPRQLGLLDAVAVLVGTLIGSGIFIAPILVARALPSGPAILAVWAFAGVLSFFGALAYGELGAMMPATGGQYIYLRESFGPLWAFLFGWTHFLVVFSAAIAWLAISFADYLSYFAPLSPVASKTVAVALIAAVTTVNYRGAVAGAAAQKTFTLLKISGLMVLVASAFVAPAARATAVPAPAPLQQYGVALIACLVAYDGWSGVSFLAGEIKNPQRNVPLALALGLAICVVVYTLANAAYLHVLGAGGIAATERLGSLVAEKTMGPAGGLFVTLTILVSIAGAANGMTLAAPRMSFAQSRDGLLLRLFGAVHPRFRSPSRAVLAFGAWSSLLALTGTYDSLASLAMLAAWLFYGMTVAGVFVLRRKRPDLPRPYRMWGYPVTPLLFAAAAAAFVFNTVVARPGPALAAGLLIAAGVPAYRYWNRRRA